MNKLLYTFLLCLGFTMSLHAQEDFRKTAPKGGPAPKIELGESTTFELDNGLTVIVVENDRLPRVNFQVYADIPPLKEGDKAGAASISGQLLATGTTKRTKAEIDEAVDFIGAIFNAGSNGIYASSLTKHMDVLLEIMSEVLFMPSFPEEEFIKIKDQYKSSIVSSKNDPEAIAGRVADILRYGAKHPYGEFVTEETIENISLEDVKAYYNTYFKPNISYLVITGDITVAKAKKIANQYFGDWEKGTIERPTLNNPSSLAAPKVVLVNKSGATQSIINVTYPVYLKTSDADWMAAFLMNSVLGVGFSGRLNQNLREDKAYTYGSNSNLSPDQEVGYFGASASVRNGVTDSAITEILFEMNRLRTEKVSEEDLQLKKNEMIGAFARGTESAQTLASYALFIDLYGLKKDHYETYLERLEAVTTDDIMAAAKKFITPDNAYIFVVGDQNDVLDQLKKFGDVEILDIYGNPVKAPSSAGDMTALEVINNYLEAIGGREKLQAIQDVSLEMEASIQGQSLLTKITRKAPNKMLVEASMMGSVVQKVVFDGEKGSVTMMGQNQKIEGDAAEEMKGQASIIPELKYTENTKMELTGLEELNGKEVYVVKMEPVAGTSIVDYYYKESGLKARSVTTASNGGQTAVTTIDMSDYQEVDGVLFPFIQKTSGGQMPFPIEMKIVSAKLNSGVSDDTFKIE